MSKIKVLPDILASQVAAGEVVERPASVVKELVDNSIDAGARDIRIDIARGGTALIRVTDDGSGMSREDALMSLERHATSKLRDAAGLASILTLGFRGEAVPSVASVTRFRMVTRETDSVSGTEITVEGGVLRDTRDAGCAPGTMIEARSLFFNLPARRKFLRAETTEAAHIEHQLRLQALGAPHVRFRYRKDEREIFDFPAVTDPLGRTRQMLGTELGSELIPLPETSGRGFTISGSILPARHARKGRRHQCVLLNGRAIEDPIVSRALAEGFRSALAEGFHPSAWIWIAMEPALVDVNVHPAKREVRFHKPLDLREALVDAVLQALRPAPQPAPTNHFPPPEKPAVSTHSPRPLAAAFRAAQQAFPDWNPAGQISPSPVFPIPETIENPTKNAASFPAAEAAPSSQTPAFRIIDVLLNRYVILENDDGLVLFDPKAAVERIVYEKLIHSQPHAVETQPLIVPVLLELDPRDHDQLISHRTVLEDAGVEIEDFGGNTLQVRSLPACLGETDARALVHSLVDDLLHSSVGGSARFALDRIHRALAKRAAASISPRLETTDSLLAELFACELPYCTAGGRPTLTEFSLREITRRFSAGA